MAVRLAIGLLVMVITTLYLPANALGSRYWAKQYGGSSLDHAFSVRQTADEGFIMAGYTDSFGAGGYDIWVLKLSPEGTIEWDKTYGSNNNDYARSIQQTSDGGYIIAGYTSPSLAENFDFFVLKLDSAGILSWQKTYGGIESETAREICQTSDGGYIVTGYANNSGSGTTDIWVLKLDGNGDVAWEKVYGGNSVDIARSIKQTADGGYIVAGQTQSFGAGSSYVWVLKLNPAGDIAWEKTYAGEGFDGATAVQQTADHGYIVAGSSIPGGAGTFDIWLLRLAEDGNVLWHKTYGGTGDDYPVYLQQTSDQGYIIAGWTTSSGAGLRDYLIIKFDDNGVIVWQKTYGGVLLDESHYIEQTVDGGYIASGDSFSSDGSSLKCLVLKVDSNGEIPDCSLIRPANLLTYTSPLNVQDSTASVAPTSSNINIPAIATRDGLSSATDLCCYDNDDFDCDSIPNPFDNCPKIPNSPAMGTCMKGNIGGICVNNSECGDDGICSMNQEDTFPSPGGNSIGDACECEGDFDCDGDVDGTDASGFRNSFGRNPFHLICSNENPCNGDFGCDGDVDGSDAVVIKADFGRGPFRTPCPSCAAGTWCIY